MEIESKVRLSPAEKDRLLADLEAQEIQLGAPESQKDVYFKERGFRQRVQGPGSYLVRVRYADSKTTLNMKRLTEEDGVWEEDETIIGEGLVAERIVSAMGAEPAVTVTKYRRMTKLGRLEIILDEVVELGTFLELAVEGEDALSARREIDRFLRMLGIGEDRVELRGYPTILLEEQGVVFTVK